MDSFFNNVSDKYKLSVDGQILQDTAIIPNFHQKYLGMTDDELVSLWNDLLNCKTNQTDDIKLDFKNPRWILGSNKYLNYRGNAIKRHKMWFQKENDLEKGIRKYNYTGWQWGITKAVYNTNSIDSLDKFVNKINDFLEIKHNHWIVTKYNDNKDNIGFHSDKSKNWKDNSCFVIVKFGEARPFQFSYNDKVFYNEKLKQGTGLIIGMKANEIVKHGVPAINDDVKVSGSIVGRAIEKHVNWNNVKKEYKKRNI